ncbi:MAG: hypothetical protein U0270_09365 [Labilithrix sp.]
MRTPSFLAAAMAVLGLAGCAHEDDLRPAREPSDLNGDRSTFSTAPPPPAYEAPPPAGRPRLSQTITLGQDDYSPAAPPPPSSPPASGVNVTVNNNVHVSPPVVYGGYGYGGSGYRGGARDGRTGLGGRAPSNAWRGSGWEGAQRTAQPGNTPAVGGNWSPPPSYGPAQMK